MLFELNVRGADGLNRSEKDRKRGKEGGRERQVSRMEASNTWCCNKAEWIVEEEETQERSGTAVAAAPSTVDGDYGRDRADVIFV